jgi:hypothetical protein
MANHLILQHRRILVGPTNIMGKPETGQESPTKISPIRPAGRDSDSRQRSALVPATRVVFHRSPRTIHSVSSGSGFCSVSTSAVGAVTGTPACCRRCKWLKGSVLGRRLRSPPRTVTRPARSSSGNAASIARSAASLGFCATATVSLRPSVSGSRAAANLRTSGAATLTRSRRKAVESPGSGCFEFLLATQVSRQTTKLRDPETERLAPPYSGETVQSLGGLPGIGLGGPTRWRTGKAG